MTYRHEEARDLRDRRVVAEVVAAAEAAAEVAVEVTVVVGARAAA